jgi:hypothetical protein
MAQVADATIELPLEPFPGGQARSTKQHHSCNFSRLVDSAAFGASQDRPHLIQIVEDIRFGGSTFSSITVTSIGGTVQDLGHRVSRWDSTRFHIAESRA